MHSIRRHILLSAFKLLDVMLMVVAFGVATLPVLFQEGRFTLAEFFEMRVKVLNFVLFFALIAVWHGILSLFDLYESKRFAERQSEILDIIKATSLGTLSMAAAAILFKISMIDPVFLLVFWAVTSALLVMSRLLLRNLLARIRTRNRNLRFILIVGTNSRAIAFAKKIESRPELGYRILGFADEDWNGLKDFHNTGYPLVCDFASFPAYLRQSVVDEVIMGLPIKSFYFHASRIADLCERQGIVMRFLSSIFDMKMARSTAEEFEGAGLISHYTGTPETGQILVKRVLDFILALISIILLVPVFSFTALIIKLTSSGPIFFRQERLGLNKRRFRIWKFRTMVPDAEKRMAEVEELNEVSGPVFKIKDDPRITPIGKLLRKTSIDELPQLFNVLKGDMSLVGPRPLPVRDYQGFDKDWQRRRFSVPPGITCLWQINGRSSIPFEKWMELDLQYIDNWSLWLDLKILARTIPVVLRGSGAA